MHCRRGYQKPLIFFVFFICLLAAGFIARKSESAVLTSSSVTLSNPRPSFRGALAAGNSDGSSQVTITTTAGAYPSTSSAQLQEGDTVRIGEAGSLGNYTITNTEPNSKFYVTPVLASGDADSADDVVSTQSATLTVRFTTANAIANGRFRILVPAVTADGPSADGIPDGGKWDFGTSAPTVTCPSDVSSTYDFVAGTATASTITVSSVDYHSFECAYSGTGAIGTAFDGSSQGAITINSLINPAPDTGHTSGTADSYRILIYQLDSSLTVQDRTTVAVGVIEPVKVTATVSPQISFRILGVSSGASVCGITTSVTTTANTVPLGDLSISSFTHASQALSVSTNASGGYAVTAIANDQLGLDGAACTGDPPSGNCIVDSVGNNSLMSSTTSDEWTSSSVKGFAYTLHEVNTTGATPAFSYTTNTGNCSGTYCARQFADAENSQSAVNIFTSSTVADNDNVYVCYKAIVGSSQTAGDYQNTITYRATATF